MPGVLVSRKARSEVVLRDCCRPLDVYSKCRVANINFSFGGVGDSQPYKKARKAMKSSHLPYWASVSWGRFELLCPKSKALHARTIWV